MSVVAHFFMSVGGSEIHERLAHFFIDFYIHGEYRGELSTFYLQGRSFKIGGYMRTVCGVLDFQITIMVFTKQLANV